MGYYVNPTDMTKLEFLEQNGHPVSEEAVRKYTYDQDTLPVCLVHNATFVAAGIAVDERERGRFLREMGGREHQWYLVPRDVLAPFLPADVRKEMHVKPDTTLGFDSFGNPIRR